MELQRASFWWIVFLVSLSTLTESRLVYSRVSSAANTHIPTSRTHDNIRPPSTAAVKQQQSARPRPVVVHCHPDSMEVVVQADVFDRGLQVDSRHLRLGSGSVSEGSACGAVPSGEEELTLRTNLMECGTKLSSTKEKIIYSNVLVYSPEPSSDGLLRLDGATIPVECHYEKRYAVDGISLQPTWVPFVSTDSAEDQIDFNLMFMTDDWQFKRGTYSYFLGDPIHVEVSAVIGNHMPLRVYVDRCVATATPDAGATLRYDFIEHHGCLADAYLTNSSSRFLPRFEEHKLRFQVDAFRFYQEPSNQVYITCYVKAVPVVLTVSSQNRACSFIENRWRSVDGNNQACRSCNPSHRVEEPPSTEAPETTISTKAWPSVTPQQSLVQNKPEQRPASYFRIRPGMHQRQHNKYQQSAAGLKRGAEHKAAVPSIHWIISAMLFYRCQALIGFTVCFLVRTFVYSIRRCGQDICRDEQVCCAQGNNTTAVTCCKQFVDKTYYNIAMVTRKLSGVLIMLLLFAVGYFVQRVLCSRSRQLTPPHSGHPAVTTSQEPLVESSTAGSCSMDHPAAAAAAAAAAQLPSYDECKRLPTYEETVRDGSRGQPESNMGQTT
ncbi:uncharacterized protein ABDE67_009653 [Symphorus nematophorus]